RDRHMRMQVDGQALRPQGPPGLALRTRGRRAVAVPVVRHSANPLHIVMAGHSRSKNGAASLAYVPAIHALLGASVKTWARIRGHDGKLSTLLLCPFFRRHLF